jgi:pyruvate/2-oxoglutarate dehydrogenase complex dihydrolipoamide dehydrogenase (E3) component
MLAVRARKRDTVESWRGSSERRLAATAGLDLFRGEARFAGPHTLLVRLLDGSEAALQTPLTIIDTGGRPAVPSLPGLDTVPFLDSTSIMEVDAVPAHLLVLGGSYVAVEFAQMFARFGSRVTVVERGPRLLGREDEDVAEGMADVLRDDGVQLVLGSTVRMVRPAPAGGVELDVQTADGAMTLAGSHLLVALGRTPNTEALDLPAAGVASDARGFIPVDARLQTNVPGIYAIGDVNGGPAFTHVSYDDFRILRANLLRGGDATTTDRLLPYVVYTDPQLGRVGLTEREARERGHDVRVATMPMAWVARALETAQARGFLKAVVDGATDRLLGAAVLGVEGGEVMAVLQTAMLGGVTASTLRDAMFAHPSLAESLNNLFASLEP